jgi:hypothetical protein
MELTATSRTLRALTVSICTILHRFGGFAIVDFLLCTLRQIAYFADGGDWQLLEKPQNEDAEKHSSRREETIMTTATHCCRTHCRVHCSHGSRTPRVLKKNTSCSHHQQHITPRYSLHPLADPHYGHASSTTEPRNPR